MNHECRQVPPPSLWVDNSPSPTLAKPSIFWNFLAGRKISRQKLAISRCSRPSCLIHPKTNLTPEPCYHHRYRSSRPTGGAAHSRSAAEINKLILHDGNSYKVYRNFSSDAPSLALDMVEWWEVVASNCDDRQSISSSLTLMHRFRAPFLLCAAIFFS